MITLERIDVPTIYSHLNATLKNLNFEKLKFSQRKISARALEPHFNLIRYNKREPCKEKGYVEKASRGAYN